MIHYLGAITNFILLSIVYILVVVPLATAYKISRKPIRESEGSSFNKEEKEYTSQSFYKQW
ncbi:MAG: hypothetical protein NVV59_03125 [Chitinophagaceae bacterium]|nr:hypothetical protein [Chitinophagaceae bacterium]